MLANPDVLASPEGSIWLFHLMSPRAEWWAAENVEPDAQWFAGALVVEHRYAHNLAQGMADDGLHVRVARGVC
jgi:hypothetical protein